MSSYAILSNESIKKEIEDEHIVIEPYNESQLNPCSYNITLSEYFFREKKNERTIYNPWIEDHIVERWEPGNVEIATEDNHQDLGLDIGARYILLNPNETILVASYEFIGGLKHITTMLKGRSSSCRAMLSVCAGAGWGDVGYFNRWAISVTNLSSQVKVVLPVGCSIVQIVFIQCTETKKGYQGKYQQALDNGQPLKDLIKEIRENWTPAMILPQLYKEKNVQPTFNVIKHD